jgi:hypothetical protein
MKIRSLRVDQFRKFTSPVVVTDFADGVNLLAECNEFGKSTLLAAIRGVLFERHVSNNATVKAMRHHTNKTSPIIALEFELPSGKYTIEKRFLHKDPYAHLTMPNGSVLDGDAAEEELQKILNFTQAGKTGSKADNVGMWAALWVTQKDSANQADFSSSARQTIQGCLEEEVGAIAGGKRGKGLLAGVTDEIAKIRNGNNKPVGQYKRAVEEQEKATVTVAALKAKQGDLVRDITDLQDEKGKLAKTEASGEEARTGLLLTEAQVSRDVAQRFEDKESNAIGTLRLCESRLAAVTKETTTRAGLQSDIVVAQERVDALSKNKILTLSGLTETQATLKQQKQMLNEAIENYDAAVRRLRVARTIQDLAVTSGALRGLEVRLELADQSQKRVNELVARLATLLLTEKDIINLRNLDKAVSKTRAILEAQATTVTFDILPAASDFVRIDGASISKSDCTLINDAVITIEGVGSIQIRPGIRERETLLARQTEEVRNLRSALDVYSAANIEQAEAQYADRELCEQHLKQARIEVATHTPADDTQNIGPGVEALRNHISTTRTLLKTEMLKAEIEVLPELAVARETLRVEGQAESEVSDKVAIARDPIARSEFQHAAALKTHTQTETQAKSASEALAKLKRDLDQILLQESSDALANRYSALNDSLIIEQSAVGTMQKSRPADSVATLDARIARYLQSKESSLADRSRAKQKIAILENRIEREEGVGIEEQVSDAVRLLAALDSDCSRFVREIKILGLLLLHLRAAEQEAKERYMAPVVRRVTPYLQTLFPGAEISCNENFQITGMVREVQQEESFDGLSDGTQEQIAVLTRLAFADMLAESGQPAMVILDDALVYSDSGRMERMFDILAHAALQNQILIFTCRGEIFNRLGGHRLTLTTAVGA